MPKAKGSLQLSLSEETRSWSVIEMRAILWKYGKNVNTLKSCINATNLINVLEKFIFLNAK